MFNSGYELYSQLKEMHTPDASLALDTVSQGIVRPDGTCVEIVSKYVTDDLTDELRATVAANRTAIERSAQKAIDEAARLAYTVNIHDLSNGLPLDSDLDFFGKPPF